MTNVEKLQALYERLAENLAIQDEILRDMAVKGSSALVILENRLDVIQEKEKLIKKEIEQLEQLIAEAK